MRGGGAFGRGKEGGEAHIVVVAVGRWRAFMRPPMPQ